MNARWLLFPLHTEREVTSISFYVFGAGAGSWSPAVLDPGDRSDPCGCCPPGVHSLFEPYSPLSLRSLCYHFFCQFHVMLWVYNSACKVSSNIKMENSTQQLRLIFSHNKLYSVMYNGVMSLVACSVSGSDSLIFVNT